MLFISESQGCSHRLRFGRYGVLISAGTTDFSVTTKLPHQFGVPHSLSSHGIGALP